VQQGRDVQGVSLSYSHASLPCQSSHTKLHSSPILLRLTLLGLGSSGYHMFYKCLGGMQAV